MMRNKVLGKKVLASLLTMSCVYLGGTSVLPMAAAAENAADNNVGKLITNGDSLNAGDIFNFTSDSTENFTALRFYGEDLDIPMTGSGVYTINSNGGIKNSAYGMVFGSSEDVETGGMGGPSESFVRATGIINGDWKLNIKSVAGESRGIIIDGGTKYTNPGSFDSINDASDITFNGKVNIGIEGLGISAVQLNGGAKGTFKDDVNIKGTSNGKNALYGVFLNNSTGNLGAVTFEKDLTLDLDHNSTEQGSNLGYGIKVFGKGNTLKVQGKTTIDIGSAGQNSYAIQVSGKDSSASFSDTEITMTGGSLQCGVNADNGRIDFTDDTKITLNNHSASTGTSEATAVKAQSSGVVNINTAKDKTVQVKGHFYSTSKGVINAVFNNANSWWEGDAQMSKGTAINVELANGAVWYPGCAATIYNKDMNLNLHDGGIVDMTKTADRYADLTIGSVNGTGGLFRLETDVVNMKSDKVNILASTDAGTHNSIDIIDVNEVTMDQIAAGTGKGLLLATAPDAIKFTANEREQSLFYVKYNLKDEVLGTGMTEWKLDGFEIVSVEPDNPDNPDIKPTTSVDTVLSANALNYHTWRTENDKLLQRMGELRHNGAEEQGAWFRVKGSKISRDSKFGFENKYTAYELGYDQVTKRTANKTRYQGVGLSYTDGSSSYSRGTGDNSSKSIGFYSTDIDSKGHYLDLVFKISNMDNDFTVYDTKSNKITGDFNNIGVSLSAEYGRKNNLQDGWYIEPQAQFTLGYLGGDNYTASNGINVDQSGIKSAVGRIGINIGKAVGNNGVVYAKASLLHEFGGGYDVTMTDSTGRVKVSDTFNDTWFEYGIGAALATGKSSHVYFDVERSAGSDFTKDWQWNVGARWNF